MARVPMPTNPRNVLPTSTKERAVQVVDQVISGARTRGDRGIAWVRLIVSAGIMVAWPVVSYGNLAGADPRAWVPLSASFIGVCSALFFLWLYKRRQAQLGHLLVSVGIDALLTLSAVAPFGFWPDPEYTGIFQVAGVYVVLLSLAASGARLSRRAVILAGLLHLLPLIGLFVLDLVMGTRTEGAFTDVVIVATAGVGTTGLAWWVCQHARRLVVEGATSALKAERARTLLGAYADDGVAEHLMMAGDVELGGERRDVAVLFSDLRGFTSYAESLDPEGLIDELNRYLRVMVKAIRDEGGTIDKFIGDAIMAVFGAPIGQPDAAARAIRAAGAMREALVKHNAERARKDQPPLKQGIGVNFGTAIVGNVGTEGRVDYTVIGDAVNLASRLEAATKEQAVEVLISEDAATAAGLELVFVTTLSVRGRERPVRVFTLAEAQRARGAG